MAYTVQCMLLIVSGAQVLLNMSLIALDHLEEVVQAQTRLQQIVANSFTNQLNIERRRSDGDIHQGMCSGIDLLFGGFPCICRL